MGARRNRERHISKKKISNKASRIRWERVVAATVLLASFTTGFYYHKNNDKKPENYFCANTVVSSYSIIQKPTVKKEAFQHINSETFRGKTINPVYQMATKFGVNSNIALDITNAYSHCSQGIIPPETLLGLIQTESSFIPNTVSYAGAKGIMQLLPSTFYVYVSRYPELFKEGNIYDVYENVCAGILYLEDSYSAWVSAYNHKQALDLAIGSYFMGVQGLKELSTEPLKAVYSDRYFVSEYVRRVKQYATIFSNQ